MDLSVSEGPLAPNSFEVVALANVEYHLGQPQSDRLRMVLNIEMEKGSK